MIQTFAKVVEIIDLGNQIILQKLHSPDIASIIKPGQFLNIKVCDSNFPLLRRPFSICDVEGEYIFLLYNIHGEGTKLLSHRNIGEYVDILAPLGKGFNINNEFDTYVIAAGGLGAAPFPYLTRNFTSDKNIFSFIGGRTEKDIITYGLENCYIATDDGSQGFKGNVVELIENKKHLFEKGKVKIFGCGPNPMLSSLKEFSIKNNFECEISTECAMACGFGICQGCPIESTKNKDKYLLVCVDGPVFNIKDVEI